MIARWFTVALAAGLICTAPIIAVPFDDPPSPPTNPTPNAELLAASAEIGLNPEGVAASGLHGYAATMMSRLSQATALRQQIALARVNLVAASIAVMELEQALSIEPHNQSLQAQLAAAQGQVQALNQQIVAAAQTLREAVLEEMPTAALQKLAVFSESQGRQVPPEFRIKGRTDVQWRQIEIALIAERRAQRLGLTLASEHAELLSTIRADFDVIEAAINLQNNLAQIQIIFAQATVQ